MAYQRGYKGEAGVARKDLFIPFPTQQVKPQGVCKEQSC